jgi:hypothetical protein
MKTAPPRDHGSGRGKQVPLAVSDRPSLALPRRQGKRRLLRRRGR